MCRRSTTLSVVVWLMLAGPATAQQVVYSTATVHGRIDLQTGADTALPESRNGLYTADGQFGMLQDGTALRMWHVPTNQTTTVATGFRPLHAHPRQPAIFGAADGLPARLDASGVHAWPVCAPAPPNTGPVMDLSADGATLTVLCGTDLVSLDTTTGAVTHRLPNAGVSGPFALSADGSEVVAWRLPALPAELVRVRLSDGQVLATRRVSDGAAGLRVTSTPRRDRVAASTCRIVGVNVRCPAVLVDATTLADVRVLGEWLFFPPVVTVSPDGRDAFVNALSGVTWLDVDSGAIRAFAPETVVTYLPAPLPPVLAPAAVNGSTVLLTWTLPAASPQVTAYRLEAGSAPGATAVALDLGTNPSTVVPGVPPGRYYARLRAVNYKGVSAPSNEIVIDVR